jgi:hypothetical protein
MQVSEKKTPVSLAETGRPFVDLLQRLGGTGPDVKVRGILLFTCRRCHPG